MSKYGVLEVRKLEDRERKEKKKIFKTSTYSSIINFT